MTGKIASIVYTPADVERHPADFYARVPLETAELRADHGIVGDRKAGSKKRQLNVMAADTLATLAGEGFQTGPGQMGEQLVLSGVAVDALPVGGRLRLGSTAVIEVTIPRTGCERFAHIQGQSPTVVAGRLGVLARVVEGGPIRVGDPVAVLPAQVATESP